MIEMSVDKETVLPGDVRVDPTAHLQSQQLTENNESCGMGPRTASAAMATSGNSDATSTCAAAAFTGTGVPMEKQDNTTHSCGQPERSELEAKVTGSPFKPKNGLQQTAQQQHLPRQPQPSQPPKLSKRRNTTNTGFKHPGFGKRRRRANSESDPVLPTNFLLGGNIFDPLNLNSLLDEEVNRAINAETPKSSPLPAKSRDPVEILIPRDITDPLNLNSTGGDVGILASPLKSGGRKRHRNRHHGGAGNAAAIPTQPESSESESGKNSERCTVVATGGACAAEGVVLEAPREGVVLFNPMPLSDSPQPYELNTSINCRDMVVPPVLPRGTAEYGSATMTTTAAAPPSQPLSSRQRKRRRASSKSESRPAVVTPSPLAKKGGLEKGRKLGQAPPQTFHTPAGGLGGGRGGPPQGPGQRKQQQKKFQYGNYNKYYGYRNPGWSEDPRMRVLRPEWFFGKTVLDLGCNTGHLTLAIAKNWQPARIVGLDIDGALVHAARQNIRHYLSEVQAQQARQAVLRDPSDCHGDTEGQPDRPTEHGKGGVVNNVLKMGGSGEGEQKMEVGQELMMAADGSAHPDMLTSMESGDTEAGRPEGMVGVDSSMDLEAHCATPLGVDHPFPVSMKISRGPIAAPPLPDTPPAVPGDFPANVSFVRANYVLESDMLLHAQHAEYDVILCLSVTKWVHLNWGDAGLQRLFHRVYRHLRPGGLFVLEPQPWTSYGKRKKLTETIFKNYHSIRFKPDQFCAYLTSEVGFSSYELIGTPKSSSRGFQRPIYLFHKGPTSHRK